MGKGKRLSEWTREDILQLHRIVKPHPTEKGKWKNIERAREQMAKLHGKDKPYDAKTIRSMLETHPIPPPPKAKKVPPKFVEKYEETELVKNLQKDYPDPDDPLGIDKTGQRYYAVGLDLYLHNWSHLGLGKEIDPTTLPLNAFEEAFSWDVYVDEKWLKKYKKRQIRFDKASALRNIMEYAGFNPKVYRWASTKGLKRPPERIYLEEPELKRFIYGINEPDTLVLARLGFEGGGRFSATSLIRTEDIMFDMNQVKLFETKTDTFPVKPFRPCTMDFLRRYIKDFDIVGKLFEWTYSIYETRFLEAGARAGIWRYKTDEEKIIYEEKMKKVKGKVVKYKSPAVEGKKTTSHLMKHTFVSLGSIHGLSYETLSDVTATDIGTLQKWYMGTGRKKTLAEIHGEVDYDPWWVWIDNVMNPHWVKRYEEIVKAKEWTRADGIKPERKPEKEKAKRPFSWEAVKASAFSEPRHPKGTVEYEKAVRLIKHWRKVWAIHEKHPNLTYQQIKERHGDLLKLSYEELMKRL